jgi:hypothetical protein
MSRDIDEDLPRVYEPFDRDHERLRTELMASLQADWESTTLTQRRPRPFRRIAWLTSAVVALAACVVLMIVSWPRGSSVRPASMTARIAPGALQCTDPAYVIMEQPSRKNVETGVCNVLPIFNRS